MHHSFLCVCLFFCLTLRRSESVGQNVAKLLNFVLPSPIPVAARSEAWVCGRSRAGVAFSNPTGCMDVCLLCVSSGRVFCVVPITRPEESYRLWFVWVWSWSRDNEEALAHWWGGGLHHGKRKWPDNDVEGGYLWSAMGQNQPFSWRHRENT